LAELGPQPVDRAVGGLPLIFIDGARDEAQQVRAFGGNAAADHFRDRAGDDHRGHVGILRVVGALHRFFGAGGGELFLGKSCDHDWKFVRGKRVGVVQDGCDGQVFAADWAVDDHAQAADGGEGVDCAPVAAGAIVVEDEHGASSPSTGWPTPWPWRR
jgi:hypothetical protein